MALLVTHEYLRTKEHNDSTSFYLIDLYRRYEWVRGGGWAIPEGDITKHYNATAMHYLE